MKIRGNKRGIKRHHKPAIAAVRADVVAALMGLFQAREDDEPVKAKSGY